MRVNYFDFAAVDAVSPAGRKHDSLASNLQRAWTAMHTTASALIALALLTFVATVTSGQDASRDTTNVKQVMLTMTIPASDAIFTAASEPPKDDRAWQDVRSSALVLAESGELLLGKGLAKDNATWVELAHAMVTQAKVASKAIDAKNVDALAQVADDMYTTCKACHDRYADK